MATKKKAKPKTKAKKIAVKKKGISAKKSTAKPGKKTGKKKVLKARATAVKTRAKARTPAAKKKKTRRKPKFVGLEVLEPKKPRGRSGRQAGDLMGVSNVEGADSESVAELLEEGNTFEADAVSGVEAADLGEGEVQS